MLLETPSNAWCRSPAVPASFGDVADLLSGSGFVPAGRWEPPVPDEIKTRWTRDQPPLPTRKECNGRREKIVYLTASGGKRVLDTPRIAKALCKALFATILPPSTGCGGRSDRGPTDAAPSPLLPIARKQ